MEDLKTTVSFIAHAGLDNIDGSERKEDESVDMVF